MSAFAVRTSATMPISPISGIVSTQASLKAEAQLPPNPAAAAISQSAPRCSGQSTGGMADASAVAASTRGRAVVPLGTAVPTQKGPDATFAGTVVALAAARRRRHGARVVKANRRFFNLFGPQEVVDPEDPGRQEMCKEYQSMPGTFVCAEESEFGWAVVSKHGASEQDGYWPDGSSNEGDVSQEWRELRLADRVGDGPPGVSDGTGQSVVKVSIREGETPKMVPYCMALGYTKSLSALALTGAHLQGALPLGGADMPPMRALVVGLGAGSIPVWFGHTFPSGTMTVDALEIDPAVVSVAANAMGFPQSAVRPTAAGDAKAAAADALAGADGEGVRVYTVGGEAFVEALAAAAGEDYKYDIVFVDAFDKKGKVPPVLVDPDGPFLKPLSTLLTPRATITLNLLIGLTGTGSSGGPKEIKAMVSAIHGTCCDSEKGEVFTVRTPINESSGNQLFGFLRAGREGNKSQPLKEALKESAEAVNAGFPADAMGKQIRFDFARRVVFGYQDWKPDA